MTAKTYTSIRDDVVAELRSSEEMPRLDDAISLLDQLVLGEFEDFLTVPGGRLLQ
jgi:hypothetical protein